MTDPHDTAPAAPSPSESLPEGWVETNLGEVLKIKNGYAFKSSDFVSSGIALVRQSNLAGKNIDLAKCVKLPVEYEKIYSQFILNKGDILIGMSGSIGKLCYFNYDGTALQNQRVGKIEFFAKSCISENFFYNFLNTIEGKLLEMGKGLAVANVSGGDIESLTLPLPPLPEQIRIADKLDALLSRVEAGRERLERVPGLLKRFRQSVLSAAVSGELTREWRGGGDAEWQHIEFSDVCLEITVGFVGKMSDEYTEVGVPFLRSQNVRPFRFDPKNLLHISERFHAEIKKSSLKPGDVVVVRSGAPGQCCVIPESLDDANCSDLVIVRPGKQLNSYYACIFINAETSQAFVNSERVGVAQSHFNVGSMKRTPLSLPPLPEQAEIVRRVEALFAIADRIEARYTLALTTFNRLTPALLAKAFRGELVPQDPNDEPAAVLLERIRAARLDTPKKATKKLGAGRKPEAAKASAGVQGEVRRGRGRPPKAATAPTRTIPLAASEEDAIRRLQDRAREKREGKKTVQPGLFDPEPVG